jgi:C4-dicarboxylate-specific signal transduction histidine kinase
MLNDFALELNFESIGQRIMQLNARAIDRGGGRPHLILLAVEDITDRIRAAEALREREAQKVVEEQVRVRQGELAHQLRIVTIGELASGLAHELNQPLSAIANGVEACARYVQSGKVQPRKLLRLLDEASSEAVRAGSIVDHLRGFIEKGEPQLEQTDLREIAQVVPLFLAHEIERAHITVHQKLGTRALPIRADRIQIEQVVVNLLQNGIDAVRDAGGDRKEIELQVGTEKGMAKLAVRDSGNGVSAADAARLFEPFFTTKSKGLGMGLAISRSIIEAHGGRIWVKARADGVRGTTAAFALPLRPARKRRSR